MVWDQLCKWTGAAFLSCCEIPVPGSALAGAPGAELCVCQLRDLGLGREPGSKCLALGDFGMAFLRPGCATHSAPSLCPRALPGLQLGGEQSGPLLPKTPGSSFWELAALCSFFPRSWCQAGSASASGGSPGVLCEGPSQQQQEGRLHGGWKTTGLCLLHSRCKERHAGCFQTHIGLAAPRSCGRAGTLSCAQLAAPWTL